MKKEKVYVVIELPSDDKPKIIDVFRSKQDAEKCAYENSAVWRNVIEKVIK